MVANSLISSEKEAHALTHSQVYPSGSPLVLGSICGFIVQESWNFSLCRSEPARTECHKM